MPESSLLPILVLLPVAAATAILLGAPARKSALATAAAQLGLALFSYFLLDKSAVGGFQQAFSIPVLPALGINLSFGVDGLSVMLLLLTAIVTLCAVWSTREIEKSEPLFYACLLFISAGAAGAFASTDIFFFYIFHELALIPTFLLIGIWGHGDKRAAAWKITVYLALGSIILLVGLLAFYWTQPEATRTFSMVDLLEPGSGGAGIPDAYQSPVYLLLLAGFGILISLFPFHTWAPQAYACAPTPAAMLHAGILKKFGLYGLIRIAVPLLPAGAEQWASLLMVLLLGNLVYVGLVTIAQKQLDLMLGYSSVMHMGYAFLGIAALNQTGLAGASYMLFAHGISIAALFAASGEIRRQTGTLVFEDLGGLAKSMPQLGLLFGMAAFASVGLPGFANFPAELMVFFGGFADGYQVGGLDMLQTTTLLALTGLVLSAVYMLRAYRHIFMGERAKRCSNATDSAMSRRLPLLLLVACLILTGFFPQILMELINPPIQFIQSTLR